MNMNIKNKDISKAINAKAKAKKAVKAIKSAWESLIEFAKDVDSVAIGFSKNKYLKQIEFNK